MKYVTNTFLSGLSLAGASFILAIQSHPILSGIFLVLWGISLLLNGLMMDYKEKS